MEWSDIDKTHQDLARGEWTVATLKAYTELIDAANHRFQAERDRRYQEVAQEKEKALKIKEEADKAALGLAREIQTYKDEKANELRSQIERERGSYPTRQELVAAVEKLEATMEPIAQFMAAQQGRTQGGLDARAAFLGSLVFLAGLAAAISPHIH